MWGRLEADIVLESIAPSFRKFLSYVYPILKFVNIEIYTERRTYGTYIPYSQKIWRGIKFGGLRRNHQIKIHQNLYHVHVCMAILFQTAKYKSANTQFGGKPPNLMTANISGYTVLHIERFH